MDKCVHAYLMIVLSLEQKEVFWFSLVRYIDNGKYHWPHNWAYFHTNTMRDDSVCTQYLPTQFLTSEVHVVGFNMFVGLKLMCILIYFQPIAKGARYIMWAWQVKLGFRTLFSSVLVYIVGHITSCLGESHPIHLLVLALKGCGVSLYGHVHNF